ncbi:dipeptide epimerase [Psychrosphaera sp. B3R10]|uniref:N-acetyl-D-Glu racemase DgcA n=1 Tax=unclassified Psychrosphaera TaxID=2641570 RepID=UPI001C07F17C|nr:MULTISPECIES: N-acetyl-D-Glu racemase DgcA [unclassified Psychrosphaera]MBU2881879.1 dipeptide epimerase [Psychrosphaera sp. I2R16]MBU2989900.1 dipeptide epimerase [Psychrosphaera sp. B3R10]
MRHLTVEIQSWPYAKPFAITGHTFHASSVIYLTIRDESTGQSILGRGEGCGVFYQGETAESMLAQVNSIKEQIEAGCTRAELLTLLPSGGARNAVDCALWDLESKLAGETIWQISNVPQREVNTVYTVSIDSAENMAQQAKSLDSQYLKVKLDDIEPLQKITAVRKARPDAVIVVDVNQGWSFEQLVDLAPKFKELNVVMIEQPLPRGYDHELLDYESPIPLCADESCLDSSELDDAAKKYTMINIKLDKTGGLTEALHLVKQAKRKGLKLMVGNFMGTSLSMAPAFVVAQFCELADLDGPIILKQDRDFGLSYYKGLVEGLTPKLWG